MTHWQLHDAKARFSELLNAMLENGPQVVTRRGVALAVVVPIAEWKRLNHVARPSLKELLLAAAPRTDLKIPERGALPSRRIPELD